MSTRAHSLSKIDQSTNKNYTGIELLYKNKTWISVIRAGCDGNHGLTDKCPSATFLSPHPCGLTCYVSEWLLFFQRKCSLCTLPRTY